MAGGPTLKLPGGSADGAGRAPYIIAVIINVALILVLSTVLSVPMIFILRNRSGDPPIAEHITYSVPASTLMPAGDTASGRRRTPIPPKAVNPPPPPDEIPPLPTVTPPTVPPPTVRPPTEIPVGIAPVTGDGASAIGRGGIRGLSPGPVDPRLLGIPDTAARGVIRLNSPSGDSAAHVWVRTYWDSVAVLQAAQANQRDMSDWTKEINGKKYGLDQKFIYFGKFRLPTMLLALLPISSAGNPTSWERNRQLESIRQDIMYQATRAANEDDFRTAVKALRDRKEQEHKAELQRKAAAAAKPPGLEPLASLASTRF